MATNDHLLGGPGSDPPPPPAIRRAKGGGKTGNAAGGCLKALCETHLDHPKPPDNPKIILNLRSYISYIPGEGQIKRKNTTFWHIWFSRYLDGMHWFQTQPKWLHSLDETIKACYTISRPKSSYKKKTLKVDSHGHLAIWRHSYWPDVDHFSFG